jgi:DNA helicase-2/ATP-dependent DNA helicase PcrA
VNLTKTQQEIVEAPLGAILVTAGAGSGKTRTLTHRLLYLLQTGIPDYQIVALTFTNKAGNEMRSRVEKLLGHSFNTFIGTFHSFCVRILRKNIAELNEKTGGKFNSNFSIYSAPDTNKVIKETLKENGVEEKDFIKKVQYHLGEWKNLGIALDEYLAEIKYEKGYQIISKTLYTYQKKLIESNALDFDDLLLKTLELLKLCPDVTEKLQHRFQYILVDEFQDTNKIQYEIVSILARLHKNIMVVGDEDQCIYSWRGASIENIERFRRDYPDAKIYKLEENFRSSKNIVDLANRLVAKNTNRIKKVLFSSLPDGEINFDCYYSEKAEADAVLSKIIYKKRNGGRYHDNAVLMRINALSRVFEERLQMYGIPYVVWGGFKFFERAEIKMCLDYMRVIINRNDETALFNIINCPRRGIGGTTIGKIKSAAAEKGTICFNVINDIDNFDTKITAKTKEAVKKFAKSLEDLTAANAKGLQYLADEFPDMSGLAEFYGEDKDRGDDKAENIYQLMGSIREFATVNPESDLGGYLQTVSLSGAEDTEAEDKVVISTIHSAKGLEFGDVFVVGLEEGIFPSHRIFDNKSELEEERRLLYVAITRAKHGLHLSFAKSRYVNGDISRSFKSRLVTDLDFTGDYKGDDFSTWF